MAEENQNDEQPIFKVADRRKFNADGSLRDGVVIEEKAAAPIENPAPAQTVETASAPPETPTENQFAEADLPNELDAENGGEAFDESNIPGAENPTSFANFMLSLASQAAAAMGLTENPADGTRRANLETSRYWLEVLAMLSEKTKGNLHPQEEKLFAGLLADLRMQYVQLMRVAEAQAKQQEANLMKQAAGKFTGKDILGR